MTLVSRYGYSVLLGPFVAGSSNPPPRAGPSLCKFNSFGIDFAQLQVACLNVVVDFTTSG